MWHKEIDFKKKYVTLTKKVEKREKIFLTFCILKRETMTYNEKFNFDEFNYEEEKRRKKQRLVRNEFEKIGKYGIPLVKKQNITQ